MKIVFMGTPRFSVKILESVHEKYGVDLVVTQPDKLVGRKKTRQETRGLIRLPRCTTSINQNGFLHTTGTIWNKLPADIRDLEISQKTFKNRLRKWIHDSDIP